MSSSNARSGERALLVPALALAAVRQYLPNAIHPLVVLATIGVGSSVLAASALSFLGLGVVPPAAEWGALATSDRDLQSLLARGGAA